MLGLFFSNLYIAKKKNKFMLNHPNTDKKTTSDKSYFKSIPIE